MFEGEMASEEIGPFEGGDEDQNIEDLVDNANRLDETPNNDD
jgi:hypothetical protein|tara:strand:+ start:722 stop:847 length:126 start_codon:yes stop_codon:yes gene_type:complete